MPFNDKRQQILRLLVKMLEKLQNVSTKKKIAKKTTSIREQQELNRIFSNSDTQKKRKKTSTRNLTSKFFDIRNLRCSSLHLTISINAWTNYIFNTVYRILYISCSQFDVLSVYIRKKLTGWKRLFWLSFSKL